jgi:hypothetical protein
MPAPHEQKLGGRFLTMMLMISIVLGILPLFGIAWTIVTGTIATQDGLFMSLILLTLSGVFFLNVYWELNDRGALAFLHKKKAAVPAASAVTPKAAAPAPPAVAPKVVAKAAPEIKDTPKESEG